MIEYTYLIGSAQSKQTEDQDGRSPTNHYVGKYQDPITQYTQTSTQQHNNNHYNNNSNNNNKDNLNNNNNYNPKCSRPIPILIAYKHNNINNNNKKQP